MQMPSSWYGGGVFCCGAPTGAAALFRGTAVSDGVVAVDSCCAAAADADDDAGTIGANSAIGWNGPSTMAGRVLEPGLLMSNLDGVNGEKVK